MAGAQREPVLSLNIIMASEVCFSCEASAAAVDDELAVRKSSPRISAPASARPMNRITPMIPMRTLDTQIPPAPVEG